MSPLATYLIETAITLIAIVTLAGLVLYGARRLGVGRPAGPLRLVGRLPLDGRRAIYLVRVESKVFVLGASEAGLHKLGEIDGDTVDVETPDPPAFREVFERLIRKSGAAKDGAGKGTNGEDEHAA